MRVISGIARRIQLKTPVGMETRPTTDRIKETLFNMISPNLADSTFLDLFSGSGGIGIEALSRGAKEAVFIEQNRDAVECIKENLKRTRMEESGSVLSMDVIRGLSYLEDRGKIFDVVFMDPPYSSGYEQQVLTYFKNSQLINEETLVIFEAALDTDLEWMNLVNFQVDKIKKYKTNMHVFCHRILDWSL